MPDPVAAIFDASDDCTLVAGLEANLLTDLRANLLQAENGPISLAVRDGSGEIIAGLAGGTSYGWLLVKVLWVHLGHRRRGLARSLMVRAEDKARERGCHAVWLDTSNPAAHAFYLALGFTEFGQLANSAGQMPDGHRRWFLRRNL